MNKYMPGWSALLLLLAGLAAETMAAERDPVVDYRIQARLDAAKKRVEGNLRLVWRNPSGDSVPDLWFHLYLNAFKNNRTTFYKESGGVLRRDRMSGEHWGWVDITSMRLADGTDLLRGLTFEHPDDDNAEDQTVARVALPSPVGPRQDIALDIAFTSQLPEVFARTGFKGEFFMGAQWFPKIGVYEPAGVRDRKSGGWNCRQFHAHSEFYADFGHYRVDLAVPSSFVVGATGTETSRKDNGDGTTTYTFEQSDIHDFAWTADPRFVKLQRSFSGRADVTAGEYRQAADLLGRSPEELLLSDVAIILLIPPAHLPQADRIFEGARLGLKYYGLWYGRYPYPVLTVVDPPFGATGAGGMEYPTLITAGTSWLLNRWPFDRIRAPEMVTVHEFGHQFWYGMVGNNEFEEAWLDEGINSYSTGKVMEKGYGRDATLIDFLGLRLGEEDMIRLQNGPWMRYDAILQPSWKYRSNSYSFYSYTKPEIALRTLENFLGEPAMARILRAFFERFRFRHPGSRDFFRTAEEVAGRDLDWFFRQAIEGHAVLDYGVSGLSTEKVPPFRGVMDHPSRGRITVGSGQNEGRGKDREPEAAAEEIYDNRFTVQRHGDFVFPVEVEYKIQGQPPVRLSWDGSGRWIEYRFPGKAPLEWARVDPEYKVLLDVDWNNNWVRARADRKAAAKWSAQWLYWMQNLICLLGS